MNSNMKVSVKPVNTFEDLHMDKASVKVTLAFLLFYKTRIHILIGLLKYCWIHLNKWINITDQSSLKKIGFLQTRILAICTKKKLAV